MKMDFAKIKSVSEETEAAQAIRDDGKGIWGHMILKEKPAWVPPCFPGCSRRQFCHHLDTTGYTDSRLIYEKAMR